MIFPVPSVTQTQINDQWLLPFRIPLAYGGQNIWCVFRVKPLFLKFLWRSVGASRLKKFLSRCQKKKKRYNSWNTVADLDFELRRGPGFNLLAQPAFLRLVISSFFTQNKEGARVPRAPPLDPPLEYYQPSILHSMTAKLRHNFSRHACDNKTWDLLLTDRVNIKACSNMSDKVANLSRLDWVNI